MNDIIISHFQSFDPILFSVISELESFTLVTTRDPYLSLVESIISQQLSVKAGDTIVNRFLDLFPGKKVTPQGVLLASRDEFRRVGMSWNKADYVHNISRAVIEGQLDFAKMKKQTDEEVIMELTKIKGIGRWTAEMFLMFTLGRPDVFSYGDVGLQNAIQKLYKLKQKPTIKQMEKLSKKWRPYRTYAARILWRSLDQK